MWWWKHRKQGEIEVASWMKTFQNDMALKLTQIDVNKWTIVLQHLLLGIRSRRLNFLLRLLMMVTRSDTVNSNRPLSQFTTGAGERQAGFRRLQTRSTTVQPLVSLSSAQSLHSGYEKQSMLSVSGAQRAQPVQCSNSVGHTHISPFIFLRKPVTSVHLWLVTWSSDLHKECQLCEMTNDKGAWTWSNNLV